ncbi:MAG: hypothetical protein Q8Q49_03325 [bacterium]|nr:hypothetical protein [bacterium]
MPIQHLPFSKIVATPTPSNWCQAYAAGGLFLTLSLSSIEAEHPEHLGALGKKIINDLEAEFFALEEKSLETIESVVKKSITHIPEDVTVSATLCVVRETVLYAFLLGGGCILIRRNGTTGIILQESDTKEPSLQSASGYLENADLVILQTKDFQEQIPGATLTDALQSEDLEEIAETLSPLIHGKEDGGSAAIFLRFTSPQPTEVAEEEGSSDETPSQNETQPPTTPPFAAAQQAFPHPTAMQQQTGSKRPSLPKILSLLPHLTHRQRLLLSIAGLLVFILLISIFFTTKNADEQKAKEVFAKTYEPAKQYLEEGEALLDLNPTGAKDNLEKAKKLVADAEKIVPKETEEAKKILALGEEIDQAIATLSDENKASISPVGTDTSKLFTPLLSSKDILFVTQDDDTVYSLTLKEVDASGKENDTKKTIIKNDGDWGNPTGIGTFLGNIYVLDKDKGILKFVKGSDGYGDSSSYLKGEAPDFSTAVAMAIDSSIYVLFANGDIAKFTKGVPDSFKVSGLTTPFSHPTRIYTLPDFTSVYVLDNGNGRIVQLGTDGTYKAQFSSGAVKKTTEFEVNEKDKKAYLLIDNKTYEMKLE